MPNRASDPLTGQPNPGTSSSDELNASLEASKPDPMLGEFAPERPVIEARDVANAPAPPAVNPSPPGSYDAVTGQLDPELIIAQAVVAQPIPRLSSADGISSIDLSSQSASKTSVPELEEDEDDEALPPRRRLGSILLMSYASAVTIGLAWLLWNGRRPREVVEIEPPTSVAELVDTRPDPGARADHSRKITPLENVESVALVSLGETVKLGVIEVTPLNVSAGSVVLVRNFGDREKKQGGKGAVKLRLRLKNTSRDTILAPLDEGFLRERPGAEPDTLIEGENADDPPLTTYPLALQSEWSIVGQEFRDLKPGESFETTVVSAPDMLARATLSSMTWRIRLRTGINHTEYLGVPFQPSDIKSR